jgi:hypothetical protein
MLLLLPCCHAIQVKRGWEGRVMWSAWECSDAYRQDFVWETRKRGLLQRPAHIYIWENIINMGIKSTMRGRALPPIFGRNTCHPTPLANSTQTTHPRAKSYSPIASRMSEKRIWADLPVDGTNVCDQYNQHRTWSFVRTTITLPT